MEPLGPILRRCVLVVDDDAALTHMIKTLLETESVSVRSVNRSEEALELLGIGDVPEPSQALIPDLILLDLLLPRIGGFEVLRRLRLSPRTQATPVIMMTGSQKDVEELVRPDVSVFLRKPFTTDSLVSTVESLLGVDIRPDISKLPATGGHSHGSDR